MSSRVTGLGTHISACTYAGARPIALDGLEESLSPIMGEDPLQALCLALALAASLLRDEVARGTRLEYAAGGDFPLEAYFGGLGEFDTPAT